MKVQDLLEVLLKADREADVYITLVGLNDTDVPLNITQDTGHAFFLNTVPLKITGTVKVSAGGNYDSDEEYEEQMRCLDEN